MSESNNQLYELLNEAVVDSVYGVEREHPCIHGHFDCATYERGPCANEAYARKAAAIERQVESEIDIVVQASLRTDRQYLYAENAEQQAEREEAIERMVERQILKQRIAQLLAVKVES